MKDNNALRKEITDIVEQYIQYNMNVEPIDGLFIAEDLTLSLEMEDDIYLLGDFYRMDDLVIKEVREGKELVSPNYFAIKAIADHYTLHQ